MSSWTVRRILARAGIASPRRRRPPEHRVRRERMPREGMLLQVDGSHHAWLEERGPRFALLLATGAAVHALFRPVRGRARLLPVAGGDRPALRHPARPLQRPPRRLQSLLRRTAGPEGRNPIRAGDAGTRDHPDLRPLTTGEGPRGTCRRDVPGPVGDRTQRRLGFHHRRGPDRARALPAALQRPLPGPGGRARGGLPRARPRAPVSPPSSASGTPAASRATTRSSIAGARSSCCPGASGPATPGRGSRCWNARAASSPSSTRGQTIASREAPPRAGVLRAARSELARNARTTSASPQGSAPEEHLGGSPWLPAATAAVKVWEQRCYAPEARDREQAAPRSHTPAARPLEGHPAGAATGALDAGNRQAARDLPRHRQQLRPGQRRAWTPDRRRGILRRRRRH